MSTDDELQPEIVNQLRNVPPVDEAMRDQHIARALSELSVVHKRRSRTFIFSAAAAVIALVLAGVVVQSRSSDSPAFASHEVATMGTVPTKGGITSSPLQSTCATEGHKVVGTYQLDGVTASLIDTGAGISISVENSCENSTFLTYPPGRLSNGNASDCSPGNVWEMLLVAHTSDSQGFFYWIGMNSQFLEMWDCATGTVVSRAPHPLVN